MKLPLRQLSQSLVRSCCRCASASRSFFTFATDFFVARPTADWSNFSWRASAASAARDLASLSAAVLELPGAVLQPRHQAQGLCPHSHAHVLSVCPTPHRCVYLLSTIPEGVRPAAAAAAKYGAHTESTSCGLRLRYRSRVSLKDLQICESGPACSNV